MRAAIVIGVVGAVVTPAVARADAPPDAVALFDQGIKDLKAGNTDAACKELAASLARFPDSGTKGALAECDTKLGKVASAWSLWRDLADTAPADLRADATQRAAQLEPRVPHFIIKLGGAPVRGLVVSVNDNPIADPTLPVALPVDPGALTAHASAPGYEDWSQQLVASEGKTITVEVPALTAKPQPTAAPPPAPAVTTPTPPAPVDGGDVAAPRHTRHVIGIGLGAAGLAGLVVGGVFGGVASGQWSAAQTACANHIDACPPAELAKATSDVNSAKSSALAATVAGSIGGAALVAGAVIYLTAPSAEHAGARSARVVPTWSPTSSGVAFVGRW